MKVGLFFGSFNPVHIGHVAVADYIVENTDVEEIWFVVSPQNPFKQSASLLADDERLKMVAMAIAGHQKIKTCDVEFTLSKPSYTIDTIHYLKNQYPENEFVLILGEDNLTRFDQWKDYEKMLSECMIYVYPRTIVEKSSFHFHPKVKIIRDAPMIDISATHIRDSIIQGRDMSALLDSSVWKYINEKKLYR